VGSKKARRKQLARARSERRSVRRTGLEVRRRRIRVVASAVLAALLLLLLLAWIVVHDSGSGSAGAAPVDYDALPVDRTPTPNVEVTP
jgi:hypothetical protein